MAITILLAEHSHLVRKGIRCLLEAFPDFQLLGEAVDLAQTIQLTNELKPQVVVMDVRMPDASNFSSLEFKSRLNHGSLLFGN
jgi:DNA-binding NarL/FixJ family response regulator